MYGLVHRHKKKRGSAKASSSSYRHLLDKATLVAGILGPMTDIPQILKLMSTQNAAGVSVLAWAGVSILDIPFILYGLAHKDKTIATTYSLWLVGNIIVLLLTVLYSKGS